jgi:hypothetical protein
MDAAQTAAVVTVCTARRRSALLWGVKKLPLALQKLPMRWRSRFTG